ncbi:hypothetical protein SRB5_54760 [Streptomyces sp. RB5]|uniref:ArsA family ATPase n=1 Tax=Streptomyces smaragdinus TaxID=2585196 RepID=A0A7K0CP78_9ACTN|nr:ArsA-related P-loop ATPase [Streptomyces smaragdinus]MQY15297.1 hypothetical protein [Streptomyces smaragdinus]
MRTVLVTGTGGAGRTALAAATARRAGRALLITADGGISGPDVVRVDGGAFFRRHMGALQSGAAAALDYLGATPLEAEELTGLAGAESLALLAAWRTALDEGGHDTVVVDLPPVHQALRLLALPEELRRYLTRLLPRERRAARALRPLLAQLAGVPAPAERLYTAADAWAAGLARLREAVEAPDTSLTLVLEADRRAVRELPGVRAALALHGHTPAAVVVNRLLPAGSPDPWLAELAAAQQRAVKDLAEQLPVHEVPHLGAEPDTGRLAALLPGPADAAVRNGVTVDDLLAAEGVLLWRMPLPGAEREDVGLVRRGDELIVTVGPYRRALALPSALRRCVIERAGLREGELRVWFAPDPAVWPAGR